MVGELDRLQHTPLAMISLPPSEVISPPLIAVPVAALAIPRFTATLVSYNICNSSKDGKYQSVQPPDVDPYKFKYRETDPAGGQLFTVYDIAKNWPKGSI